MTFFRTLRPAASRSRSHLLFSIPAPLRFHLARPADFVSAPTLPLFHRDTPLAPQGAPSKRAPAAARNTRLPLLCRLLQTSRRHPHSNAPPCKVCAPCLAILSC